MTASGIISGRRRASPRPVDGWPRTTSSGSKACNPVQPKVYTIAARRRLLLTRLILHWGERRGAEPLSPGQSAALAASLAQLLDKVAAEEASFARMADLVPEGLAEHWRVVHQFLNILPQHWPRILAE